MHPKSLSSEGQQGDLFRSRLEQILDRKHPLFVLANQIDWGIFEQEFGSFYVENVGRPGLPIRLMVGLHYLKYTYNQSDESVVARFIENPYWQYFCGYEYFQHVLPLDPTSLVKWRKRIGPDGLEGLLKETVDTAKRKKLIKKSHLKRVNVDTTVQEKAVSFPTDARLYHKMRRTLVREAKARGIKLRQSYERLGKHALYKQGRYSHARQMKRAKKETKRLKVYLGRILRDIERKCPCPDKELQKLLSLADRIFRQQQKDSNKVYSVHAPEVECICKGKVHKRYEFGCKVSVVTTSKDNWVVGIESIHGNPYDGHTLKRAIEHSERMTGWHPANAYCDKGYRRAIGDVADTTVHLSNKKKRSLPRSIRRWLRRRSAIEPVIGHLKSDNRMERNHLLGRDGDRINAILAACGFNLRKLLKAFFLFLFSWLYIGPKRTMLTSLPKQQALMLAQ